MNEKFWTFIKIIAAVIATVLIYNFMNKGILSEFIEPSIVESSMDKLHEILMSRTREADAKENLDKIELCDKFLRGIKERALNLKLIPVREWITWSDIVYIKERGIRKFLTLNGGTVYFA